MKTQIELETISDIEAALKLGPVFCDVNWAKHIPVRDVRGFRADRSIPGDISARDPLWSQLATAGQTKGFEVLLLEGWRVPERVYREQLGCTVGCPFYPNPHPGPCGPAQPPPF